MNTRRLAERPVAAVLTIIASVLIVCFFEWFPLEDPLALDWRGIWRGIQGGVPRYGGTGLRNPPWSLLPILPLGLLSFRASLGLLTLITLGTLISSVPRCSNHRIRRLSVFLLITSFPAIRHFADGNLEGLVIAGIALVLYSYHTHNPYAVVAGALIATAKIQETWLLIAALAIYIFRTWSPRRWVASSLMAAMVLLPCILWFGRDWLQAVVGIPQRGSIMDTSLVAATDRLDLPFLGLLQLVGRRADCHGLYGSY
jgi:hypothetical protein